MAQATPLPGATEIASLEGRRALITGGGRGIGRAIAELMAARGAQVMVSDVMDDNAAEVAEAVGGKSVHCDVTKSAEVEAAVQATVDAFGGIDLLVNNAGIEVVKPLFEHTEDEFDALMTINVKGVFLGMKAAAPQIIAAGGGSIVNLASLAGQGGAPLFGGYCASKAAVVNMGRVAAVELRDHGVRVNTVCPGFIDTLMVDRLAPIVEGAFGIPWDDLVAMKQGRLGTVQEVAEMAVFLASDDASWITGADYGLDGGVKGSLL